MIVQGVDYTDLRFNKPEDFPYLTDKTHSPFHPSGGNTKYFYAPSNIMTHSQKGQWHYNAELALEGIGTELNEIIAFLPGVTDMHCNAINFEYDTTEIPNLEQDLSEHYKVDMVDLRHTKYHFPENAKAAISHEVLSGKSYGCFKNANGENVRFHILVER